MAGALKILRRSSIFDLFHLRDEGPPQTQQPLFHSRRRHRAVLNQHSRHPFLQTMVWNVFGPLMGGGGSQTASKSESSPNVASEAKEVDYETNCTMLYRKIEETEWISVTSFLESGYWPGNFFADEMTPSEQARTWVTRFDHEDRKKLRWSQLPLQ